MHVPASVLRRKIAYWQSQVMTKSINWKDFVFPRVAELLNHKEKQRSCPLLDANKHTHTRIYGISNINMYIYRKEKKNIDCL